MYLRAMARGLVNSRALSAVALRHTLLPSQKMQGWSRGIYRLARLPPGPAQIDASLGNSAPEGRCVLEICAL